MAGSTGGGNKMQPAFEESISSAVPYAMHLSAFIVCGDSVELSFFVGVLHYFRAPDLPSDMGKAWQGRSSLCAIYSRAGKGGMYRGFLTWFYVLGFSLNR